VVCLSFGDFVKLVRTVQAAAAAAAIGVCALGTAGCNGSPTAPSSAAVYSQTDLRVGTGAPAQVGGLVRVNYTGWFYDASQPNQKGLQFDSSAGTTGLQFTLGIGSVIPGWDQGVAGMAEGGFRRLVIPPSLGYGAGRYGPIPPNTTLVFEIELLSVGIVPIVTTQPADQSVTAGQTATFTFEATGASAVQWQVSSDGGSTWRNLADGDLYSGVTTTTLTVTGVTSAINGSRYRAVLTNSANSVSTGATNSATLTVR
jgi:FKBP-type peptidyl-prolyl cis-trans isomerase FkpA